MELEKIHILETQRATAVYRIALLYGGRLTDVWLGCLLPQVQTYLLEHPSHWVDVHLAVNTREMPDLTPLGPILASCTTEDYTEQYKLDIAQYPNARKAVETDLYSMMAMLYFNNKVWRQVKEPYDAWLKFRPDLVQQRLPEVPPLLCSNTVCIPGHSRHGIPPFNDQVAFGIDDASGNAYFSVYEKLKGFYDADDMFILHPESAIGYAIQQAKINVKCLVYPYSLHPRRRG